MDKNKVDIIKIAFYAIMAFAILYLFGYGIFTDYAPFSRVIFNDGIYAFKDFWECVNYNREMQPYQNSSCYPAIANLFFVLIAKLVPANDSIITDVLVTVSTSNQMLIVAYYMMTTCIFIGIINKHKAGNSVEKVAFSMFMLLSAPFIYMFERGNIILIALLLLMIYVWGKDSKSKWIRELSYMCLGLSAAIKIYPAVFGLLLLKDSKYKEAARCVLYGVAFFILPFFAFGGINDIKLMFSNMAVTNKACKEIFGVGYRIDISATLEVIVGLLGFDKGADSMERLYEIAPYLYMVIAVAAAIFHKSKWKTMALLASMIVLVPGYSYVYTLIFFIIPLISFLDSKEKRTWMDWIYLVGFTTMFIPIVYDAPNMLKDFQVGHPYVLSTFVQGITVLSISSILVVEGFVYGFISIKNISLSKLLNEQKSKTEVVYED